MSMLVIYDSPPSVEEPVLVAANVTQADSVHHVIASGGYDHLKKPYYLTGTLTGERWDRVVKVGRYGEGLCARLGASTYIHGDSSGDGWGTDTHNPSSFMNQWELSHWAANVNMTPKIPNGYNCTLPWTMRMHVYQKPDSIWYVTVSDHIVGADAEFIIAVMNGEIRRYSKLYADFVSNTYTVLATVPNIVENWYDLEFRQDPITPLVRLPDDELHLEDIPHTGTGYGDPVPVIWRLKINGVEYVTVSTCQTRVYFDNAIPGPVYGIGNRDVFLDNYYAVFMTPEGMPYLQSDKWVIRGDMPESVECRGQWTAVLSDESGERSVGGDYTDRLRFSEPGGMINDVNLTEYESSSEGLYPICKTPLITDFTYNIPTPTGSTPVLCWATTMEKVPTSGSPNWFGVWVVQPGKPSYNRRSLWLPYFGTDSYAASSSDLHSLAADVVLPSDRSIAIYQKYLKDVVTSGTISISTDYVGGELYSDWDATSPLPG